MPTEDPTLRYWQSVLDAKPGHPPALIGMTKALAELNRGADIVRLAGDVESGNADLAERMLRIGSTALPQDPDLGLAYCRIAERRGDWAQVNLRWSLLRRKQQRRPDVHAGYVAAMLRQNRFAEAERASLSALSFLGKLPELQETHARVAEARCDWAEAARRWAALVRRSPGHAGAVASQQAAEQRAREPQTDPAPVDAEPMLAPAAPTETEEQRAELKKLVTGFESIGRNCEFGILQRHFGAEPLGLLRFSATQVHTLTTLLRSRFAGIGDLAANQIVTTQGEYTLNHVATGWRMHTMIRTSQEVDVAKLLKDQCRHTSFLRSKIIKDLQRQSKIFVFWKADLRDQEISKIYQAVQEYGPNMLMCVRLYDAEHAPGTVEWRTERLMVASLDRQGCEFRGAGWDISADCWVHFCRIAQARRDALQAQAAEAIPA